MQRHLICWPISSVVAFCLLASVLSSSVHQHPSGTLNLKHNDKRNYLFKLDDWRNFEPDLQHIVGVYDESADTFYRVSKSQTVYTHNDDSDNKDSDNNDSDNNDSDNNDSDNNDNDKKENVRYYSPVVLAAHSTHWTTPVSITHLLTPVVPLPLPPLLTPVTSPQLPIVNQASATNNLRSPDLNRTRANSTTSFPPTLPQVSIDKDLTNLTNSSKLSDLSKDIKNSSISVPVELQQLSVGDKWSSNESLSAILNLTAKNLTTSVAQSALQQLTVAAGDATTVAAAAAVVNNSRSSDLIVIRENATTRLALPVSSLQRAAWNHILSLGVLARLANRHNQQLNQSHTPMTGNASRFVWRSSPPPHKQRRSFIDTIADSLDNLTDKLEAPLSKLKSAALKWIQNKLESTTTASSVVKRQAVTAAATSATSVDLSQPNSADTFSERVRVEFASTSQLASVKQQHSQLVLPKRFSMQLRIKGLRWSDQFANVSSPQSQQLFRLRILPQLRNQLNGSKQRLDDVKLLRLVKLPVNATSAAR